MHYTDFLPELKRGESLVDDGRFDEALAICDEVLARVPDDAAAFNLKCVCFLGMGCLDEAEEAARTALRHFEGSPVVHTHLGDVLYAQGRNEDALLAYEQAIRFDTSCALGFIGRGRVRMFHLYDSDGAMSDFTKALELDPNASRAWFLRGLCRLGCQMVEEARKDFVEALKLDPALKESIDEALVAYHNADDGFSNA
jgi:Flp pilus assembly protein TadD